MGAPTRNTNAKGSDWVGARKAASQAPQRKKGQALRTRPFELGGRLLLAGASRAPPKDLNP